MIYLFLLILSLVYAEEPSTTMIVEAHRDLEVYVSPTKVINLSKHTEAIVDEHSSFGYNSLYWKGAKFKDPNYGVYERVTIHTNMNVYNEDTIQYAWDNCDYSINPRNCAWKNNHYILETTIIADDHEITVRMVLFNSDMQIVGMGIVNERSRIKWIRQQETTAYQQSGLLNNSTIVSKPKEELPIKWLIPANLFDSHIQQASVRLWTGLKIN